MSTSTNSSEAFAIPIEAAEFYESAFVPAFFAQWAPLLCDAAGLRAGQSVLDVGCGTGIVARTAAARVGPAGNVVGVDPNDAMLTVARRVGPGIDWREGAAERLAFPDASFDVVLTQMAMMFFADPIQAMREMARVVTEDGTVAVCVPARLEAQRAFAPFVEMAARYAGDDAVALLSTYFVCGDLDELAGIAEAARLRVVVCRTEVGTYRAPSVDTMVTTEVESTPLGERITPAVYQRLREDAHDVLRPFTNADGSVEAPFECNIVAARRAP